MESKTYATSLLFDGVHDSTSADLSNSSWENSQDSVFARTSRVVYAMLAQLDKTLGKLNELK